MRKLVIAFGTALAICATPAMGKKQPALSPLAMQQMQTRDYEVRKDVSFPSVMTVLQDAGYRIEQADRDTGLITGVASTQSKLMYNIIWGLGKKKHTPVVSAFIEDRGKGSRVRLNFVMSTTKSRIYGQTSADEMPINDAQVYRDAFEKIDREIFVRLSTNTPIPPTPTPAGPIENASTQPVAPAVTGAPK